MKFDLSNTWSTPWRKALTIIGVLSVILTFFGAIPAAVSAWPTIHRGLPILYFEAQDMTDQKLAPILAAQNSTARALDHMLLFQQGQAIEKLKQDPGASISPRVQKDIRDLQEQYNATQKRIKSYK